MRHRKRNILSAELIKRKGKMVHLKPATRMLYRKFIEELPEGQRASILVEAHEGSGRVAQLGKIHACIREIAISTGSSFRESRQEVKIQSGLYAEDEVSGEVYEKSFGACSADELGLVIEAIVEIGDFVGINFRGQFPKYE